jgi:predicted RNase H-like HicB family nuclease
VPEVPAYGYRVSWSEKDGECVATCVEIAGLSGLGSTPARAVAQLKVAIGAWIDYLASRGLPAPPPARSVGAPAVRA